jgi:uncharacterized LabA/DUF88 family protein
VAIPCYAVLIDGGFVRYALKAKHTDPPISDQSIKAMIQAISHLDALKDMRLHRVYFYDAKPLTGKYKRPDGKEFDFSSSKMASISQTQHESISRLPYVAMRYGELSFRGWKVKDKVVRKAKALATLAPDDLEPNVQQKGVDMRIGLDISALALKRQVQVVVLVTGDSDLVPAMKLARREGLQLVLICLGQNVKDLMHEHADIVVHDKAFLLPAGN